MQDKKMKLFSFTEVFLYKRGERLISEEQIEGDIPYISSTKDNNGVNNYIAPPEKMTRHYNKMTFSNSGSVGYLFYHNYEFVASDHVTVIWLKNNDIMLTEKIALYLKPIFESMKDKYNFGREIKNERIKNEKILLPINDSGEPDWDYMTKYIDECISTIKFNPIKTEKTEKKIIITEDWKAFELIGKNGVFNKIYRGKRLKEEDRIKGTLPLITAGKKNQGIADYIENEEMERYSSCITIDMFCNCFYRNYEFCCDDNILVLNTKYEMNKYNALFLITILNQDRYKFSYGRQYRQKHTVNHKIMLPSKISDRGICIPDFKFMENYIKELSYSDKL